MLRSLSHLLDLIDYLIIGVVNGNLNVSWVHNALDKAQLTQRRDFRQFLCVRSEQYIIVHYWRQNFEGHPLLFGATPPFLSCSFHFLLSDHRECSLSFGSPCLSLPCASSPSFCAVPVTVPYLPRAVLVGLLHGILVCSWRYCVESMRS